MLHLKADTTPKAAFAEIMKQLSTEIVQQTLSADNVLSLVSALFQIVFFEVFFYATLMLRKSKSWLWLLVL